jgi:hypothetical protein
LLVKWDDNGTIVMRMNPAFRVVLVESALLTDIYGRIEKALGVPIRHIVFEAERAAAKATIDTLMPHRTSWLVRNQLVLHPASRILQTISRLAGMADVHTVFYHVFHGSMALVRNPFDKDIYGAMVVGAFETVERVLYAHDWMEFAGENYLVIMPAGEKPDISGRLQPRPDRLLPGDRRLETCGRCGFPVALNHLHWDIPNAIITDTRRGTRMSFVDGYAFSAVFRELIAELGDDIVPIIIEAAHEYTQRSMAETGFLEVERWREDTYREFVDLLAVYGQGNPREMDTPDGALRVVVENPYSPHLLAGQLLALFESVEGRPGSVDVEELAPQRISVNVVAEGR